MAKIKDNTDGIKKYLIYHWNYYFKWIDFKFGE